METPRRRYQTLDTLRGVTIVSMILYHACWDLVWIFGADWPWYRSDGAYLWQQSICWSLGRHRLRRGLMALGGGALVSAVTLLAMPEDRVLFGVLTLLGTSALLLIPLERPLRRLPARAGLAGSFTLFLLLRDVNTGFLGFEGAHLAALPEELYRNLLTAFLGFPPADFYSTDYFSLLPWFFLFLTGYFLRRVQLDRQARPERDIRLPVFSTLGRHSLLIYLVHQPLVFGLLTGLELLLKK